MPDCFPQIYSPCWTKQVLRRLVPLRWFHQNCSSSHSQNETRKSLLLLPLLQHQHAHAYILPSTDRNCYIICKRQNQISCSEFFQKISGHHSFTFHCQVPNILNLREICWSFTSFQTNPKPILFHHSYWPIQSSRSGGVCMVMVVGWGWGGEGGNLCTVAWPMSERKHTCMQYYWTLLFLATNSKLTTD